MAIRSLEFYDPTAKAALEMVGFQERQEARSATPEDLARHETSTGVYSFEPNDEASALRRKMETRRKFLHALHEQAKLVRSEHSDTPQEIPELNILHQQIRTFRERQTTSRDRYRTLRGGKAGKYLP